MYSTEVRGNTSIPTATKIVNVLKSSYMKPGPCHYDKNEKKKTNKQVNKQKQSKQGKG